MRWSSSGRGASRRPAGWRRRSNGCRVAPRRDDAGSYLRLGRSPVRGGVSGRRPTAARESKRLVTGDRDAIGIFDSGVGGLTVMHQLIEALPAESLVYLGDTGRYPYGSKSPETVTALFPRERRLPRRQRHQAAGRRLQRRLVGRSRRAERRMPRAGRRRDRAWRQGRRGAHEERPRGRHRHRGDDRQRLVHARAQAPSARLRDLHTRLSAVRTARGRGMDRQRGGAGRRSPCTSEVCRKAASTR